eukprot:736508-Hanusia_phi.AAC.1
MMLPGREACTSFRNVEIVGGYLIDLGKLRKFRRISCKHTVSKMAGCVTQGCIMTEGCVKAEILDQSTREMIESVQQGHTTNA